MPHPIPRLGFLRRHSGALVDTTTENVCYPVASSKLNIIKCLLPSIRDRFSMMGFREFDHLTDNPTGFDFGRGMRRSLADPRTQGFFLTLLRRGNEQGHLADWPSFVQLRKDRVVKLMRDLRRDSSAHPALSTSSADGRYSTHPLSLSANYLTVMHGKVTHSRISPFLSFTKS